MSFFYPADLDLSSNLMQVLTPLQGRLLLAISKEADRQHLPLYMVGGFVRDLLLGNQSLDFDLVVEGDSINLAGKVAAVHGGKLTIHSRFKTAQWIPPTGKGFPKSIDFISARSEYYRQAAALPTVKVGSLIDDLRRRDFTINTLAVHLNRSQFGHLEDCLGGLEDLKAGLIRVIHPDSFLDDPTRLFRAIRYEVRYGFKIAPETKKLLLEAKTMIAHLSAERIRHELELILEEEKVVLIMKRLAALGILQTIHPLLTWDQVIQTRFVRGMTLAKTVEHNIPQKSLVWLLWLINIPTVDLKQIEKRLHFNALLRKKLMAASSLFAEVNSLIGMLPSQCTEILDAIPLNAVEAVFLSVTDSPAKIVLQKYLGSWRHMRPKTSGHDLENIGLKPGPTYQLILDQLRNAWLDGELASIDQEKELLDKLLKESPS